jgi:Phospholipase_D-nuclease N-terminal
MVIAADYPFLNILGTMIIFFAWVVWIWMMIAILSDVFRRRDIGGWGKAAWTVFMILLPFVGVLSYLITNHSGMTERRIDETRVQQAQFDDYVRTVAKNGGNGGDGGPAAEIEKGKQLLDNGTITAQEFEAIKAKAIA